MTTEPTNEELASRMASGDREAFAALFRRHQATVFRFSRHMLGSAEAAEDVTQDVFIGLASHPGRFNPAIGSFTTYLYGIARHLILQRHRRSRGRVEVALDTVDGADAAKLTSAADPTDDLSRDQMVRHLRLAILRLPVRYREVIVLCELNGLSYEDAAGVARCPVGTIRSRLSRARRLLIERCRFLLTPEHAGSDGRRMEGGKTWLIATKNNC